MSGILFLWAVNSLNLETVLNNPLKLVGGVKVSLKFIVMVKSVCLHISWMVSLSVLNMIMDQTFSSLLLLLLLFLHFYFPVLRSGGVGKNIQTGHGPPDPNLNQLNIMYIQLGVGYKWVIFCFIFATVFLYSICPISTWNDLFFGLGAKKKVRPTKIQNGRHFPWKITFWPYLCHLWVSLCGFGV